MSEEETSKPKIIVDDDWKSRAQAEKEQLQQQAADKQEDEPQASADEASTSSHAQPNTPLPPASFAMLVTSLATQALMSMGQIPGADGKPVVELDHAKHFIDTLGILDEKTKGNLSDDEAAILENALHELRLIFVTAGKQGTESQS